jgi:RHS repeat-associated protein
MGNLGLWSKTALSKYRVPLPGGSELVSGTDIWHRDWLGSVRLASSLTGRNSVKDTAFAPYGETYATFGSATDDINFTGDNQDLVAGIFDTPNRELNPDQGRWLSPDPSSSGWNAYAYSDNPLGEVDPTGLSILDWLFGSKNCSSSTGKSCRWNNAWNGDNLQYAGAGIWLAPGSGTVGINCGVITGCGHGLHQITIKWSETNGGAGDSWDRSFISESVGEFEWDLVREGIFLGAARGTPSGDGGLVNGSVAMARNWLKQPTKYGTVATDINGNHWIQLAIEDIEKGNQWALESQMVVDAWVNGNKNPGYYIVKLTSENYMNRLDALDAEYNLNKFGRGMLEAAHAFPTTPRLSMYGNMPKDLRPNMEDMFKYKREGD